VVRLSSQDAQVAVLPLFKKVSNSDQDGPSSQRQQHSIGLTDKTERRVEHRRNIREGRDCQPDTHLYNNNSNPPVSELGRTNQKVNKRSTLLCTRLDDFLGRLPGTTFDDTLGGLRGLWPQLELILLSFRSRFRPNFLPNHKLSIR